jgi:hypothetical protein
MSRLRKTATKVNESQVEGSKGVKKEYATTSWNHIMANYPLFTNGVQSAVINAAGVFTSQALQNTRTGKIGFDIQQIMIFMIIGAFVINPLVVSVFIKRICSLGLSKFQLLVVSTLFGTLVVNAAFVFSLGVLIELFDPSSNICLKPIVTKVFSFGFLHGAIQSRIVFLPADILNIYFIPPMWQPLVINLAGYIWTVVLAMRSL